MALPLIAGLAARASMFDRAKMGAALAGAQVSKKAGAAGAKISAGAANIGAKLSKVANYTVMEKKGIYGDLRKKAIRSGPRAIFNALGGDQVPS